MDKVHFFSKTAEWGTPQSFFDEWNAKFNFDLDVCATDQNAKCAQYFTKETDGLSQDWTGKTVWCNPPYGREMPKWIAKCAEHAKQGGVAVMLIPARTDTAAFHDFIYGNPLAKIHFIRGRLHFVRENGDQRESAPFPSMIVVFGGVHDEASVL